jgi:hypothetical protein
VEEGRASKKESRVFHSVKIDDRCLVRRAGAQNNESSILDASIDFWWI